jgi:uncharacterized membrane protein YsdA (DUF1294 family)/cold shock CspA family protein
MRFQGTLCNWNDERGFGFIKPDGGGQDIFVNVKAFPRGQSRPSDGARLSFQLETGPEGKKRATAVTYVGSKASAPRAVERNSPPWPVLSVITLAGFPFLYLWGWLAWGVSWYVLLTYLLLSAVTYFTYMVDKDAAEQKTWRVSEANLHLLALAGGWPGANLAQQFLRHKSKKMEFRFLHWLVTSINIAGFVALGQSGVLKLSRFIT